MTEMHHGRHERLRDDLAAYALGALDAEEAERLKRHLEGCEECKERLRRLRPAVDVLPASIEQRTPPASLRKSLMETVRAEAGETGRGTEEGAPRRRRRRTLTRVALRPAAGFAAVLLLAVGVATGYLLRGSDEVERSFVRAQTPPGLARDVSATLERHDGSATLHVHKMPKLDRDEVYEVWVQRAGGVEPASVFVLGRDGSGEAAITGPLGGAESVLVTREPRGGSRQPTNPPLLEARLR